MKLSRAINIPLLNSFFLFGPRGTGKTSLLETVLPSDSTLFIDLLNQELLGELQAAPNKLNAIIAPAIEKKYWIVIDEVQRVPQLLDIVHHHIERSDARFALTGSSARKLRRGAANLLAGRAYVFRLFPFLAQELGDNFTIEHALRWGTLPRTYGCPTDEERSLFLKSYTETYLQEEIVAEQAIRNLPPFRRFLQIASQTNATVVNFSKVADDIQTDPSNVKNYFQILEDTLVGFFLEPFHFSLRKRQRRKPKFYWFDCGVCRALSRVVDLPLHPSTYEYGRLFETFVISQIRAVLDYLKVQAQLSYLEVKDGGEIDLIVERPGLPTLLVEIKSGETVREEDLLALKTYAREFGATAQAVCLYQGTLKRRLGEIDLLPWKEGLKDVGLWIS